MKAGPPNRTEDLSRRRAHSAQASGFLAAANSGQRTRRINVSMVVIRFDDLQPNLTDHTLEEIQSRIARIQSSYNGTWVLTYVY
jgi:hypothetical protein